MTQFRYVVDNLGGNTVGTLLRSHLLPETFSSFATAYFTVSGFELIANQLEKCRHFRLLIGSEPGADPLRMTIQDIWKNIDIKGSSKQAERAVNFFLQDNVEIRLHPGPFFHGKTYILNHPEPIFEMLGNTSTNKDTTNRAVYENIEWDERERPITFRYKGESPKPSTGAVAIVGSSNFTYGGFSKNTELNLFDPKGESLIELLTWFEERWDASHDFKNEFVKMLQGYYKPFPPFWIYAKALYELYKEDFSPEETEKLSSTIELADFQKAGYRAAKRILDQWNGVLISDAPGLGKTYIAGKLLEDHAYYERENALIICPAEVDSIWRKFAKKYNIPIEGGLLHTEVLGRGMKDGLPQISPSKYKNYSFILVDESHHFRNPEAGRYAWLQQLFALPKPEAKVEGKIKQLDRKVVFITATPVNNSVWDLYWQFLLIFGEKAKEIAARQGITSLHKYFESAEKGEGNLYDLIERMAVRRSRAFIKEYYPNATLEGKTILFPERKLELISYTLHKNLGNLYVNAAAAIENCNFVPYCIEGYKKGLKDRTKLLNSDLLTTLFKVLLLKRLESSLWAFRISIQKLLDLFEAADKYIDNGHVLSAKILRELILENSEEDDTAIAAISTEESDIAAENFDTISMKKDLEADKKALKDLLKFLPEKEEQIVKLDEKIKSVKKELKKEPKKILLFTSFMDTATYLFNHLQNTGLKIGLVTGDDCRLWDGKNETTANRANIMERFSPISNDANLSKEEEIDILVATDVFSEAINLQDANAVLNYDLPWNPMKLVQRAGRIDRMGSQHESITVYNVFPEKGLEALLKLMKKLHEKIAQTHRSVGLEWSLLGEEPMPIDFATIERIKSKDPRVLIDIEHKMEGLVGLDPQEQLLAILQTLSKDQIEKIPDGVGSLTTFNSDWGERKSGFFVVYRRRRSARDIDRIWRFYPEGEVQALSNKTQIVDQIKFPKDHPAEDRFGDLSLQILKEHRKALEDELQAIEMKQRTPRITGSARKAFEFVQRVGRADLDRFLQTVWMKDAIQKKIRRIDFTDEQKALKAIEELQKTFGVEQDKQNIQESEVKQISEYKAPDTSCKIPIDEDILPVPEDLDCTLELVCWMHILPSNVGVKIESEVSRKTSQIGQQKFKDGKLIGQSKFDY